MSNRLLPLYHAFRDGLRQSRVKPPVGYDDRFDQIDRELFALKGLAAGIAVLAGLAVMGVGLLIYKAYF